MPHQSSSLYSHSYVEAYPEIPALKLWKAYIFAFEADLKIPISKFV